MSAPGPRAGGWWRRNRWALAVLPLALALADASGGDRVRTRWWEHDLRVPTTAAPGTTATFHQERYDGRGGTLELDVQVTLDGVGDARPLPAMLDLPPGTRAVQVDLTLSAAPDVALLDCRLAVRDAAGTRYDYDADGWGAEQPWSPCVPADAPGPWPSGEPDDDPDTDAEAANLNPRDDT